jgi:hypothetical protein
MLDETDSVPAVDFMFVDSCFLTSLYQLRKQSNERDLRFYTVVIVKPDAHSKYMFSRSDVFFVSFRTHLSTATITLTSRGI